MTSDISSGIITQPSSHSVDETVRKLEEILKTNGITLFAVIDHSGEAKKAGFEMPNTKLVIFGNPKGGTSVMLATPSAALDLPLKILVAEDNEGAVWLSFNNPEYIQARHGFPKDLMKNIAGVESLVTKVA